MAGAFGFSVPNQTPTPDPRQVGQQLMQPRQPQQQLDVAEPVEQEFAAMTREQALRREGGKLMGSGGDDQDAALSQAVGEALTRAGGGHRGNPNPAKNREGNIRLLQQLGISPLEAELLGETV